MLSSQFQINETDIESFASIASSGHPFNDEIDSRTNVPVFFCPFKNYNRTKVILFYFRVNQ